MRTRNDISWFLGARQQTGMNDYSLDSQLWTFDCPYGIDVTYMADPPSAAPDAMKASVC
jgi:hypothetical protein